MEEGRVDTGPDRVSAGEDGRGKDFDHQPIERPDGGA